MQVSGIGSSISRYIAPNRRSDVEKGRFDNLIASAAPNVVAGNDHASIPKSGNSDTKPDYKNMSASEFKSRVEAMFARGEIDLHTLGVMTLRTYAQTQGEDTYGAVGGGKFDYTKIFKGAMDFVARMGQKDDPKYGYGVYESILAKIS